MPDSSSNNIDILIIGAGPAGLMAAVQSSLVKGDNVQLIGFGTFAVEQRAARIGRNPATGKELKIPAKKVAKFKVGSKLKDAVAGGKAKKK